MLEEERDRSKAPQKRRVYLEPESMMGMEANIQTGPFVVTKVVRKKNEKAMTAEEKQIECLRAEVVALKDTIKQLHGQIEDIKAADTVRQHESKQLGKRGGPCLSGSDAPISEAVATLIKKRRRTSKVPDCKPNIQQLRA